MTSGRGPLWALILTFFALALPAVAQAAPTWQLTPDPAPGGVQDIFRDRFPRVSLAVVGARPFVATVLPSNDLRIFRCSPVRSRWVQVGGVLNSRPVVGDPEMASSTRTPWVAWRERTAGGSPPIHVPRLRGPRFKQINGGLKRTDSGDDLAGFDLAVFGGLPYVAYQDAGGVIRVVRLDGDDHQFRNASTGLPRGIIWDAPPSATAGGRLYLAFSLGVDEPGTSVVSRLSANRRTWRTVA